jgi:hypothetical protein
LFCPLFSPRAFKKGLTTHRSVFWLGPKGLPSPELDPAQLRWEALIIERRNGVVRMERDELSSFVIAVHEVRRELGR